jgi:hypothetical protein
VFPYPFEITQDSDLIVLVNAVALNTDNGYTLSGQGAAGGGNLTFTLGQTAGTIITLYRNITIARISQLAQNGTFFSSTFNNEFNRIYLIMQQLQEAAGFSLSIPNTNNPAGTTLLTPALYANKYLSFDSNGNPTPAVLTSTSLTGALVTGLINPVLAIETAAGVSVTNTAYAPGVVDRYKTNTTPGTTDMSPALQAAINVALYANGSGFQGIPVRFGPGAYAIATLPTFGTPTNVQSAVDIGGAGKQSTQLYYTGSASPSAGFLFVLPAGSHIHDLMILSASASKCGGVSVDGTTTATTFVTIERVASRVAGIGFQFKNTNTCVIRDSEHWADNDTATIIPNAIGTQVTASDINHGIYATGGYANDISIYDFRGSSSVNYASGQRGIKSDATNTVNFRIRGALLVNESPTNSHQVLELGANGGGTHNYAAEVIGVYHQNAFLGINGSYSGTVMCCSDSGDADVSGVSLAFTAALANTIASNYMAGSLTFDAASNSNFLSGSAYSGVTDNSAGLNYYAPGFNRGAGAISTTLNGNVTINAPGSGIALTVTGTQKVTGGLGVNGATPPAQSTGFGTPVGGSVIASYNITDAGGASSNTNKCVAEILTVLKAAGLIGA